MGWHLINGWNHNGQSMKHPQSKWFTADNPFIPGLLGCFTEGFRQISCVIFPEVTRYFSDLRRASADSLVDPWKSHDPIEIPWKSHRTTIEIPWNDNFSAPWHNFFTIFSVFFPPQTHRAKRLTHRTRRAAQREMPGMWALPQRKLRGGERQHGLWELQRWVGGTEQRQRWVDGARFWWCFNGGFMGFLLGVLWRFFMGYWWDITSDFHGICHRNS